jgi:hypothetical protein
MSKQFGENISLLMLTQGDIYYSLKSVINERSSRYLLQLLRSEYPNAGCSNKYR